jgi:hypothetical protein
VTFAYKFEKTELRIDLVKLREQFNNSTCPHNLNYIRYRNHSLEIKRFEHEPIETTILLKRNQRILLPYFLHILIIILTVNPGPTVCCIPSNPMQQN